jgi:uncharacterized protein YegL
MTRNISNDDVPNDDIGADYADNPAPRLPCVVIVDGSTSMTRNDNIGHLNRGLERFAQEIKDHPQASLSARIKVIRIGGGVETLVDWCDAIDFVAPTVRASGDTPLGRGVKQALSDIEEEKRRLDAAQILRKRAWLFMLTDGEPNDRNWEAEALACRQAEHDNIVSVFPLGVDDADMEALAQFTDKRAPRHFSGEKFEQFFVWLTKSIVQGTRANAAENGTDQTEGSNQRIADDSWLSS